MRNLIISLSFLFLAIVSTLLSHSYLRNFSYGRPIIPDIIHQQLPDIPKLGYAADLIVIFSFILLLDLSLKNKQKISYYIFLLANIHFIRAILIILNPVGDSFAISGYKGLFPGSELSQGMFPSGHTATVFLVFLLIDKRSSLKIPTLTLVILEIFSLLVSKGHYSIDIVGGILLSYSAYKFFENYQSIFIKK